MTKQISCDSKFQFQISNIIIHSIGQNKKHWCTNNIKMEDNEFKKPCIKYCTCYYFDDIIKL